MRNKKLFSALLGKHIALATAFVVAGAACVPSIPSYAAVNPLEITKETSDEAAENVDADEAEEKQWETIEISDAQGLVQLAKNCALDTWSQDKYIKLTDDIHLAGSKFEYFATFGGIFDGNGHSIDGLVIKSDLSYLGFFSKLQPSGVVKNLTVGGNIAPGSKQIVVGGIVGDNYGVVDNCSFAGVVKGNDYTGGIVGYNESTGIILNCKSYGTISGQHYTGGIAGANQGGIYHSVNKAQVNTTNVDKSMSIEDINIDTYLSGIMDLNGEVSESKSLDTSNNAIDTGGIVGHTSGVVEFCTNQGDVGYERVGYNVGGIAGRQSGYLHGCKNEADILGRKDVGGIVGQAEPYVQLDFTEDIINKLTVNINDLHDLVDKTLDDSGDTSNKVSDRLELVQRFVDSALDDTSYLSGETIHFVNGLTTAGNEALSRADYAMDEAGKDGGAIDKSKDAMNDVNKASENLKDAVNKADVYGKMSESDKTRYDNDTEALKAAKDEHQGYYDAVSENNYYYALQICSQDQEKEYHDTVLDLKFYQVKEDDTEEEITLAENDGEKKTIHVYHVDGDGNRADFPSTEEGKADNDAKLIEDATLKAAKASNDYADQSFRNKEGRVQPSGAAYPLDNGKVSYSVFVTDYSNDLVSVVEPYAKQSAEDAQPDLENATKNLSHAAGNLNDAASQTSDIFSNLNGRGDITLPVLGDGYQAHTDSFVANMQAMSENLGYLNEEMNHSSNVILDDMSDVNDSFNKIMLLFTDAMDGALDGEYADRYEDESLEVASECTDGTVADCSNVGSVSGDLDVSGIAGAMGIEYDFDLEGDVTSNQDARINSTFKTKCVLRANKNEGRITAQKNYAGGLAGVQEMGIILYGENYGRIASNTGDYVGGIAGNSVACISNSYSKGIMSGDDYVGGIVGYGHEIHDSYAIPAITEASGFVGAIAGEVDDESKLSGNLFVSEELAGIDRISYSTMAEPVSYEQLMELEDLPKAFDQMQITFLVDDEVIGVKSVDYGHSLTEQQYPESIVEEDYYIDWDTTVVHDVTADMEIIGEPALYRTTIAGKQLRSNRQSVVLVDGKFKESQSLDVDHAANSDRADALGKVAESWTVQVPNDGQETHRFRVQLPEDVKKASIYVQNGEDFVKADAGEMGMYKLFEAAGDRVSFVIVDETTPVWVYLAIGAAVLLVIGIMITVIVSKKKKKHPKASKPTRKEKKEKRKKKTKQALEVRKERLESGLEKAQQLIEKAKDDSPRGEK